MKTNVKKILIGMSGAFLCLTGVSAAGNEKGIEYYRAELYDAAKIVLNQQAAVAQGADKAEAYYYLGECYAAVGKTDSAAVYYQKSAQADVEYPYAYIGEGKLALEKGTQEAAGELFKKAIGFAKKDPAIMTSVAEAYAHAKMYTEANEALDKARKINKNFSGIYVAEGDMLKVQGKTGDACAKYENAILFDNTDKVAYLKEARMYKQINATSALEILGRLLQVDPGYIPAYAEIGEINFNTGFYDKGIEAYAKFIEIPGVPIKHHINYASLLYFTKNYSQSLIEIKKILKIDPQSVVMLRLQSYNNYELGNFPLGLEQMEVFMKIIPPSQIIAQDYIYYGRLLDKNKKSDQAVEYMKKALALDSTKADIYKDIAVACVSAKDFQSAIPYYEAYLDKDPNSSLIDVYNYGVANYSAARQESADSTAADVVSGQQNTIVDSVEIKAADSIRRVGYLVRADQIFGQVIERSPNSYLGYLWRGHANSGMDLDASKGLAKPHYEKALEIMLANNPEGKRNKDIVDVYRYLGFYYYVQNDVENSKLNFTKILEIDPTNEIAKQALESMK